MSAISVQVNDPIATLTIDDPGSKVNVFGRAMLTELAQVLTELVGRKNLHGLIIQSGKPGIFIAGADLKEFAEVPAPNHPPTRAYIEQALRVLDQLESLPYPTIACIDGAALGGGLEVALACDYRIAGTSPKTKFGLPETTLGLIPGWGGTQRLPRLIGPTSSIEITINNLQLDAEKADYRRLIKKVVPSENLLAESRKLLEESHKSSDWRRQRTRKQKAMEFDASGLAMDAMSSGSMTEAKMNAMSLSPEAIDAFRDGVKSGPSRLACLAALDTIAKGCRMPLKDGLKLETDAFMQLIGSPEAKQLIGAFFASRKK